MDGIERCIDDEIPFDLPESWEWVRFFSVVDIATNLVRPEEYADYVHIAPDNIEQATGTIFLEKWSGKKILLTVAQIKAFGKTQPALRIKPVPKRLCSVCGNIMDNKLYEQTMSAYGKSLCSAECKKKAGIE